MDYVPIPSYAQRIDALPPPPELASPTRVTAPPSSDAATPSSSSNAPPPEPKSPTHSHFSLSSSILASAFAFPSIPSAQYRGNSSLITHSQPLSLQTTAASFRRFTARCGPIFWLLDRAEEIIMWKKSWKYTGVWIMVYFFFCQYPRLFLALPHVVFLGFLLSVHTARGSSPQSPTQEGFAPPYAYPAEGSSEWLSNLQAIQNALNVYSDVVDVVDFRILSRLGPSTPYAHSIVIFTFISLICLLLLLPLLPLRLIFLFFGLAPFALTHPISRAYLPVFLTSPPASQWKKELYMRVVRLSDDDRLEDRHLHSELREVELWENERLCPGGSGASQVFSKTYLRAGERKGWTRGRDGWSEVGVGSHSRNPSGTAEVNSNLTFALEPGWAFVETEDWRRDLVASWADVESDDDGWVYSNDAWMETHSSPFEEWKASGVTRRRRWTRRIYKSVQVR